MATKKVKLSNIETGELLSWVATTQACWEVGLKLYDSKNVYFNGKRSSCNVEPPLSQGSANYEGSELTLEIDVPSSKGIKVILNTPTYMDDNGTVIGHGFICCGEAGSDGDYNDFYLSLVGWKRKG